MRQRLDEANAQQQQTTSAPAELDAIAEQVSTTGAACSPACGRRHDSGQWTRAGGELAGRASAHSPRGRDACLVFQAVTKPGRRLAVSGEKV